MKGNIFIQNSLLIRKTACGSIYVLYCFLLLLPNMAIASSKPLEIRKTTPLESGGKLVEFTTGQTIVSDKLSQFSASVAEKSKPATLIGREKSLFPSPYLDCSANATDAIINIDLSTERPSLLSFPIFEFAWSKEGSGKVVFSGNATIVREDGSTASITVGGKGADAPGETGIAILLPKQEYPEKDILYIASRKLGLIGDGQWRRAEDSGRLVLQKRIRLSALDAARLEIDTPKKGLIQAVNIGVDNDQDGSIDSYLLATHFLERTPLQDGERCIVNIGRALRKQNLAIKQVTLAEIILFIDSDWKTYRKSYPIKKLYFSYEDAQLQSYISPYFTSTHVNLRKALDYKQEANGTIKHISIRAHYEDQMQFRWRNARLLKKYKQQIPIHYNHIDDIRKKWGITQAPLRPFDRVTSLDLRGFIFFPQGLHGSKFPTEMVSASNARLDRRTIYQDYVTQVEKKTLDDDNIAIAGLRLGTSSIPPDSQTANVYGWEKIGTVFPHPLQPEVRVFKGRAYLDDLPENINTVKFRLQSEQGARGVLRLVPPADMPKKVSVFLELDGNRLSTVLPGVAIPLSKYQNSIERIKLVYHWNDEPMDKWFWLPKVVYAGVLWTPALELTKIGIAMDGVSLITESKYLGKNSKVFIPKQGIQPGKHLFTGKETKGFTIEHVDIESSEKTRLFVAQKRPQKTTRPYLPILLSLMKKILLFGVLCAVLAGLKKYLKALATLCYKAITWPLRTATSIMSTKPRAISFLTICALIYFSPPGYGLPLAAQWIGGGLLLAYGLQQATFGMISTRTGAPSKLLGLLQDSPAKSSWLWAFLLYLAGGGFEIVGSDYMSDRLCVLVFYFIFFGIVGEGFYAEHADNKAEPECSSK